MQHDPKGKVKTKLPQHIKSGAEMSDCERYRYVLWRAWGQENKTILWIGMNPSTADALHNDPTCTRELNFSIAWGFEKYLKANVLDWRATFPKDIPTDPKMAASATGREKLLAMAIKADMVIAAWGKLPAKLNEESHKVAKLLAENNVSLFCLGTNKDGSPKHPLYLRKDLTPQPWTGYQTV
jgi:hypothetical protein